MILRLDINVAVGSSTYLHSYLRPLTSLRHGAPSLLTLPGDLLKDIFSFFFENCLCDPDVCPSLDGKEAHKELAAGQEVIASLCRTSKALKAVAEPHLYHSLSTHDFFLKCHVLFIRSLYKRPGLGSYLRRAAFVMYSDETRMERTVDDVVDNVGPLFAAPSVLAKVKRYKNPGWQVDYMQRQFRQQLLAEAVLGVAENLQHVAIEGLNNGDLGIDMPASSNLPVLRSLRLRHFLRGDATNEGVPGG